MSRAQKLFVGNDMLSSRKNYAKYLEYESKEVYLETSADVYGSQMKVWFRGKLERLSETHLYIMVYASSTGVLINNIAHVDMAKVTRIRLAGEDIYEEIMRR